MLFCSTETSFSPADMSEFKVGADIEAASLDPGQQWSTIPGVSEEELAKFVSLTPLSKTLQEIKESLQILAHTPKTEDEFCKDPHPLSSPSVIISPAESEWSHLIPVAPYPFVLQHFAVFLFGCHVVCLLSRACSFPPSCCYWPGRCMSLTVITCWPNAIKTFIMTQQIRFCTS